MSIGGFWKGKKVFITGHTGFKGSWLCLWLYSLGAEVYGYALAPHTNPSLFELCGIGELVSSVIADVRDRAALSSVMSEAVPDVAIHMAAQPIVLDSYKVPVDTYEINVMGTVHFLEAVRNCPSVKSVINVTSDKCYRNMDNGMAYGEDEPLGGYDPYSSSKACSELVTSAYRSSFFNPAQHKKHGVGVASARAGNVIGGGDWAEDRLMPDCIRAMLRGEKIIVRNPDSVRPWQHVLEPLGGYLLLAERLYKDGENFSEAWNFGPNDADAKKVEWLVGTFCRKWGEDASYKIEKGEQPHEARYLRLDSSKARSRLGWRPLWGLEKSLDSIIEWARAYKSGKDMTEVCMNQIKEYMTLMTVDR